MDSELRELLREAASSVFASTQEEGITEMRREYRKGLHGRLVSALEQREAGSKGRYFCDGPNGYFYMDSIEEARQAVNLIDPEGDDWTITDTLNPFAAAPSGEVGDG